MNQPMKPNHQEQQVNFMNSLVKINVSYLQSTNHPCIVTACSTFRGKSERVCPTCDMIFLPHVDPHVIDEHMVFHQVYKKKSQSN